MIGIPTACGFTTATTEACRRDLDKMTRLADYFVVIGYDLDKRGKRDNVTHRAILLLLLPPDLLCRIDTSVLVAG